jgi:hypothetical protein
MDEKLIAYLCFAAYRAYTLSLQGTGLSHRNYEFAKGIAPGQLVMEVSSIWMRKFDQIRVGYLETITREPFPGDWDGEEKVPMETVYYIKALSDGETKRWTNCDFIRLVEDEEWLRLLGSMG